MPLPWLAACVCSSPRCFLPFLIRHAEAHHVVDPARPDQTGLWSRFYGTPTTLENSSFIWIRRDTPTLVSTECTFSHDCLLLGAQHVAERQVAISISGVGRLQGTQLALSLWCGEPSTQQNQSLQSTIKKQALFTLTTRPRPVNDPTIQLLLQRKKGPFHHLATADRHLVFCAGELETKRLPGVPHDQSLFTSTDRQMLHGFSKATKSVMSCSRSAFILA